MTRVPAIGALALALVAGGCGGATVSHTRSRPTAPVSIRLSSSFAPGGRIPTVYTCDGQDLSPPLRATGIPAHSAELVVLMVDHDAPGGDFIHWGLAHINPRAIRGAGAAGSHGTGSAALLTGQAPSGAVPGRNSFGSLGYRGPCPPPGSAPHHYEITLFALARLSGLRPGFSAGEIGKLRVRAEGTLTGIYGRR